MFKKDELKDANEIKEFILEFSTDYIDEELIFEYFFGCKAVLKLVSTSELVTEDSCHHIRDKKKETFYKKLPIETMPPLIVEKGIVFDGNHRLKVAKKRKQNKIYIYDIIHL